VTAPFRYLSGDIVPVSDTEALTDVPGFHLATCFGCGPRNPNGLHIVPTFEGDKVTTRLIFDRRFEGGPGLVHGGAVAAFFDDLIGFVPMAHQKPAVTAKLETNFIRPIPLGMEIRGEAWLSRDDGRKLWVEGVGYGPDETVFVEVSGLYIQVGAEHFTRAIETASAYIKDEYYP